MTISFNYIMGCTTSAYDNPDITQRQVGLHPIIKSSHSTQADESVGGTKPTRLKSSKVAPLAAGSNDDCLATDGRGSPALSDRTDTNKSIKRVAFTDNPHSELGSQVTVTKVDLRNGSTVTISGSPTELRRARRKREKNLRKHLLNKMGEAESISERLLLESERLSLTSSMSRATSRTGSSFPLQLDHDQGEDNTTEATDSNTRQREM